MLNSKAVPSVSTWVPKAEPDKLDIKIIKTQTWYSISVYLFHLQTGDYDLILELCADLTQSTTCIFDVLKITSMMTFLGNVYRVNKQQCS